MFSLSNFYAIVVFSKSISFIKAILNRHFFRPCPFIEQIKTNELSTTSDMSYFSRARGWNVRWNHFYFSLLFFTKSSQKKIMFLSDHVHVYSVLTFVSVSSLMLFQCGVVLSGKWRAGREGLCKFFFYSVALFTFFCRQKKNPLKMD